MRLISSFVLTYFNKRVFPVIWFGAVACFLVVAVVGYFRGNAPIFVVMVPTVMLIGGYFLFRALLFNLMDEVLLGDEEFIVRRGSREERIPFATVLNIYSNRLVNPERITLTLRTPCQFGTEVSFLPPMRFLPIRQHPLALELNEIVFGENR